MCEVQTGVGKSEVKRRSPKSIIRKANKTEGTGKTRYQAEGCLHKSQINRLTGYSALNIDQRSDAGSLSETLYRRRLTG